MDVLFEGLSEEGLALARLVSLATRIDPALLRKARLDHVRQASVATEAEVWFSGLVEIRTRSEILFHKEASKALRAALVEAGELERAWDLVKRFHASRPILVQLEDELAYLALSNRPAKIEEAWQKVFRSIERADSNGVASWALGIAERLPEAAYARATMVRASAERRLHGEVRSVTPSEAARLTPEERAFMVRGASDVQVGVSYAGGTIEISEPPSVGAEIISVPPTRPRRIETEGSAGTKDEITWTESAGRVSKSTGAPVALAGVDGRRWSLDYGRPLTVEAARAAVESIEAVVRYPDGRVAAAGIREGDAIYTVEQRRAVLENLLGLRQAFSSGRFVRFVGTATSQPAPALVPVNPPASGMCLVVGEEAHRFRFSGWTGSDWVPLEATGARNRRRS
jgi:hypothetical protein